MVSVTSDLALQERGCTDSNRMHLFNPAWVLFGRWPIELTSGYERFVASLAMRVALTEISNLPKISALFVDEGFGTLDSENIVMMPTLFTVLKNYYDFILVVSHLDTIRDAVDKTIEITHEGGFAKVVFE